jgi:hypothetical protein
VPIAQSALAFTAQEWQYHLRTKNLSPATIRSHFEAERQLDEQIAIYGRDSGG